MVRSGWRAGRAIAEVAQLEATTRTRGASLCFGSAPRDPRNWILILVVVPPTTQPPPFVDCQIERQMTSLAARLRKTRRFEWVEACCAAGVQLFFLREPWRKRYIKAMFAGLK